jgi:DNA-binding XRE family transcriptional regulator
MAGDPFALRQTPGWRGRPEGSGRSGPERARLASTDRLALFEPGTARPYRDEPRRRYPVQREGQSQRHPGARFAPFESGALRRADRLQVATVRSSEPAGPLVSVSKDDSVRTTAEASGAPRTRSSRQRADAPLPGRQEWLVVAHTSVVRETVATNLRSARKHAGLSQSALAEHSGVDKRTISRIERAQADTVVTRLYVLAFALSVPVGDLLAGLPEP